MIKKLPTYLILIAHFSFTSCGKDAIEDAVTDAATSGDYTVHCSVITAVTNCTETRDVSKTVADSVISNCNEVVEVETSGAIGECPNKADAFGVCTKDVEDVDRETYSYLSGDGVTEDAARDACVNSEGTFTSGS